MLPEQGEPWPFDFCRRVSLGGEGIDASERASVRFSRAISECHAISNGTRRKPFGFLLAIIGRVLRGCACESRRDYGM